MMTGNKNKLKVCKVGVRSDKDLLDSYSPFAVGKIPATNQKEKDDAFKAFKPKPDDRLDYKISETLVRMDCGDTKINLKQTTAEYKPLPAPVRKNIIRSHVGKVQMKYIDEVRREKQEELQKAHAVNFKKFVKGRRLFEKRKGSHLHERLMSMVGPAWYQELSPSQMSVVECLEWFLYADHQSNTTTNTQYGLASLGLAPRPKIEHIQEASQLSAGDVVQFLLILYQLINPKRTSYSLNDRLLLSAVVHLTMLETLYELHVRIPSPPRIKETVEKVQPKPKKKPYKSPYLVPFTFKPKRTSTIGAFEKKKRQFPESQYFLYKDMLRKNIEFARDNSEIDISQLDEVGRDIRDEKARSQILYNRIHNTNITLADPTYHPIMNIRRDDKSGPILPRLAELEEIDIPCECQELEEQLNCCNELEVLCECDGQCTCKDKSRQYLTYICSRCRRQRQHKNSNNLIFGVKWTASNSVIPIIGGTFVEKTCNCVLEFRDKLQAHCMKSKIQSQCIKYVMGAITISKIGPVYSISNAVSNKRIKQLLIWQIMQQRKTCSCANKNLQNQDQCRNESTYCRCDEDELSLIPDSSPADGRAAGEENEHMENGVCNQIPLANPIWNDCCKCRNELDIFLKHQCTCERCNIDRRRLEATYYFSGMMDVEDDDPVNIIAGIQEHRCDCLKKYQEKLERLQEYKKRIYALFRLRSQSQKFAIGGVCMTADGPQYLLTGVRQPVMCACGEMMEERRKAEEAENHKAKLPNTGRIKYAISGVQEGNAENTYILSHALPVDKCSCEKLYDAFVDLHQDCMSYYDQFMAQITEEKSNYDDEMRMNPDYDNDKNEQDIFAADIENEHMNCGDEDVFQFCLPQTTETCNCDSTLNTNQEYHENSTKMDTVELTQNTSQEDSIQTESGCSLNDAESIPSAADKDDGCVYLSEKISESEEFDSSFAIKLTDKTNNQNLKRFVILEKFTCQWSKWKPILKKVLNSMADDGFPLAIIPECLKLPHFKLWMYFRCGKSWTPKEMADMNQAHYLWTHTDKCSRDTKVPTLNIKKSVAQELTWRNAAFCKKMISNKYQQFYRKLKRQRIDAAREFFPTTFTYQFPNENFRNCFFAYLPSKEGDIFVESLEEK